MNFPNNNFKYNEDRRPKHRQIEVEKQRILKIGMQIAKLETRLDNDNFCNKAPQSIVANARLELKEAKAKSADAEGRLQALCESAPHCRPSWPPACDDSHIKTTKQDIESTPRHLMHYCIFCDKNGDTAAPNGSKCGTCGHYRGSTFCFPPGGPLQKGDTFMGRKLAFVKWPWQGDPHAPYVRAVAAPDPMPNPKPLPPLLNALNNVRIAFEDLIELKPQEEAKDLNISVEDNITTERLPFFTIRYNVAGHIIVVFKDDKMALRDKQNKLHFLDVGLISDGSACPKLTAVRLLHYVKHGRVHLD